MRDMGTRLEGGTVIAQFDLSEILKYGDCLKYVSEFLGWTPTTENDSCSTFLVDGIDYEISKTRFTASNHQTGTFVDSGNLIDLAARTRHAGNANEAQQDLGEWLWLAPVKAGASPSSATWDFDAPIPIPSKKKKVTPKTTATELLPDMHYDLAVEAGVIGTALVDPKNAEALRGHGVNTSKFYDPANALIWSIIERCPHGMVEVQTELRSLNHNSEADRLYSFVDTAATVPAQIPFYAAKLTDLHTRRTLTTMAKEILAKVPTGEVSTMLRVLRMRTEELNSAAAAESITVVKACDYLTTEPPAPVHIIERFVGPGDKLAMIAASKTYKTFIALQIAIAIATGTQFAGMSAPIPRKVLFVNLEIRGHHFHRRVNRTAKRMGADLDLLGENLFVINVRDRSGASIRLTEIEAIAKRIGAEVIYLDPLYKLHQGDENAAADMKPLMQDFDRLAEATGAAIAYVHHDPKGSSGDKKGVDRGAGSGVVGRDYDAAILLTAHRSEQGAIVVEFIARNYEPREPVVIRWNDGAFTMADDLEPSKETATGSRGNAGTKAIEKYVDQAFRLVKDKSLTSGVFHEKLKSDLGLSEQRARALTQHLLESGTLAKSKRQGMTGYVLIGTPGQIREITYSTEETT